MFRFCVLSFPYRMNHSYEYFQKAFAISIPGKHEPPAPAAARAPTAHSRLDLKPPWT